MGFIQGTFNNIFWTVVDLKKKGFQEEKHIENAHLML